MAVGGGEGVSSPENYLRQADFFYLLFCQRSPRPAFPRVSRLNGHSLPRGARSLSDSLNEHHGKSVGLRYTSSTLHYTSKGGDARGRSDGHLTASVHHNSEGAKKDLWKRSKKKKSPCQSHGALDVDIPPRKKERQRCLVFFRGNSFIREKLPRAVASRTMIHGDFNWRRLWQRARPSLFHPKTPAGGQVSCCRSSDHRRLSVNESSRESLLGWSSSVNMYTLIHCFLVFLPRILVEIYWYIFFCRRAPLSSIHSTFFPIVRRILPSPRIISYVRG